MRRVPLVIAGLLSLCGCAVLQVIGQFDCSQAYVDARYANVRYTTYALGPFQRTPGGIQVNASGQLVNFNKIDELTAELETCLGVRIKRCGVRITVAPDATFVQAAGEELFLCRAGSPDGSMQRCAGVVEYPATVIVSPDLHALKHELIHAVLHVGHSDPRFALCQGPSV